MLTIEGLVKLSQNQLKYTNGISDSKCSELRVFPNILRMNELKFTNLIVGSNCSELRVFVKHSILYGTFLQALNYERSNSKLECF